MSLPIIFISGPTAIGKSELALNLAKNAKDRSIFKLVKWLYLLEPNNHADFYDYINFINLNSNFPRLSRLRYLAEHKITTKLVNVDRVIKFFSEQDPLSGYGKLILGYSHIEKGNNEKGKQLIKEGWITAKLSKRDLRYFKKKLIIKKVSAITIAHILIFPPVKIGHNEIITKKKL